MRSTTRRRDAELELATRKQQLLIRSAELRVTMAHEARALEVPLAVADQVTTGIQWLRNHPQWPAGALVLLAVLRPRRVMNWGTRLWWGWRMWNKAQSWLSAASGWR